MQQLQQPALAAQQQHVGMAVTPLATAPQATPTGPQTLTQQTPHSTQTHDMMPAWAQTIMIQCTETHKTVESVQAKMHVALETSEQALKLARENSTKLTQQHGRLNAAHDQLSMLSGTLSDVQRSVGLLDRQVHRPNWGLENAKADIQNLSAQVKEMATRLKLPMRSHTETLSVEPETISDEPDAGAWGDAAEADGEEDEAMVLDCTPSTGEPQRPARGTGARRAASARKRSSGEGTAKGKKAKRLSDASE